MVNFVQKYSSNIHSQNGEDGIIAEILRRINFNRPITTVEFGGADGFYCSNTANLNGQTKKYYYDIDPKADFVKKAEVTPENINDLPICDLISIDIDNNDYHVWKSMTQKPAIVVIEINSGYDTSKWIIPGNEGTSYLPMVSLGVKKGYFLVCHTGNLVFVDMKYKGLFPEIDGDPITNAHLFFNKSWLPS